MTKAIAFLALLAMASPALAQTVPYNSGGTPVKPNPNSPFGTEWAKPSGTTGGMIYNDPRTQPNAPGAPTMMRCPQGSTYSPQAKRCL